MTISFSCDHGGFELKEGVLNYLKAQGYDILDLSPQIFEPLDDFPDYAGQIAQSIIDKKVDKGILICGTGIGMSIAANRHKNIRAVVAYSPEIAKISRSHNDANIACFGARTMKLDEVISSLDVFLSEPFIGDKYQRRNDKMDLLCGACENV